MVWPQFPQQDTEEEDILFQDRFSADIYQGSSITVGVRIAEATRRCRALLRWGQRGQRPPPSAWPEKRGQRGGPSRNAQEARYPSPSPDAERRRSPHQLLGAKRRMASSPLTTLSGGNTQGLLQGGRMKQTGDLVLATWN